MVNLVYQGRTYGNFRLSVLPGLCADLILGIDFQSRHESVVFTYGGPEPSLSVCGVSTLNIEAPEPFENLTAASLEVIVTMIWHSFIRKFKDC